MNSFVDSYTSEVNKWTIILDNININDIHPKIKCEFIMVAEESTLFTRKLKMIEIYSRIIADVKLVTISPKDIYDFVDSYKEVYPTLEEEIAEVYSAACTEADVYICMQKPIPIDLLIKLIKLKIITVVKEIVLYQQKETVVRQQREFFIPPETCTAKTKGKGKDKGKKETASKEKPAKPKKDKKGKSKEEEEVKNLCDDYQYVPKEYIRPDKSTDIQGAFIYIALVRFYVANFVPYCHWNGMPLRCIIKFGETKAKQIGFPSIYSVDSIRYEQDHLILRSKVQYMPKQELQKRKEQFLTYFWQRLNEMYHIEKTPYVKDSFIMNYNPLIFYVEKANSQIYLQQCEEMYDDFLEFICKIRDYKRQYKSYLKSLKITPLEQPSKKIELSEMHTYKNKMDSIPIDVVDVGVILHSLIEEICYREDESKIKLADKLEKQNPKKQKDDIRHHCVRDQLKNIFSYFKTTRCKYLPSVYRCRRTFDGALNDKTYIVHESNRLEMNLYYYKYLSPTVYQILFDNLTKTNCLNCFSNYPPLTDAAVTKNKSEILEWCSLLNADEKDLCFALVATLISTLIAPSAQADDGEECLRVYDYFPVPQTVHEIRAKLPLKAEDTLPCMDQVNPYEQVRPLDLKWVDRLPSVVLLQELLRAFENYEYFDCKYVELFDLMVYRFHHKSDEFGITTKLWKETVRTPVTFNDFMTFVVQLDLEVILEQKQRFEDEQNLLELMKDVADNVSDLSASSVEFTLPGSIKEKLTKVNEEILVSTKGKKVNEGKSKSVGSKTKSNDSKKEVSKKGSSKKNTANNADNIADAYAILNDEPCDDDIISFALDEEVLKRADPPRKINALDFRRMLLTSSGICTSFYSFDDLKVIVDQVQICDRDVNLSVKIGLNGHDLILHRVTKEHFCFHVNFKSGAILACGRPASVAVLTEDEYYFLTEECDNLIHCMKTFHSIRKTLTMSNNTFGKLIKNVKIERRQNYEKSLKRLLKSDGDTSTSKLSSSSTKPKTPFSLHSLISQEQVTVSRQGFVREVKALKRYLSNYSIRFKVFSSRLHKYNCLMRIPSPVELNLNAIIRFIARNKRENKRKLRIKRRYNIQTEARNVKNYYDYDFRITLPSGLHLRNIKAEKGTCVCQYYFDKSAICTSIFDEDYRVFLGNGSIAVRKTNGKFVIYTANGEIINYDTIVAENLQQRNRMFSKEKDVAQQVPKFLKHLRKNIYKFTKKDQHSKFISSRRMWKKEVRKFLLDNKNHAFSDIKFKLVSSEGKIIYYENSHVIQSEGYFIEKDDIMKDNQTVFKREDGTVSVLTNEGHIQTTFPDGTKITAWCEVDPEPVTVDLSEEFDNDCEDMGSFLKIVTCYQYEHPHYITLLSNGPDAKIMLRIPSGEIFDISDRHFLVGIDEWTTLLATKEIIKFVTTPCERCGKSCDCSAYIKQLYDPPEVIDNTQKLIKVSDTYNKSFTVYYNGSSDRNEVYSKEKHRCKHASHRIQPTQAFFTVNRDYSGSLIWTNDDFMKRLSDANDQTTNYLTFYVDKNGQEILTTEWKIYEKLHHNFRFTWPQCQPYDDDETYDTSKAAFVKQRIIKRIPAEVIRNLIEYITMENVHILLPFHNIEDVQNLLKSSSNLSLLSSIDENVNLRQKKADDKEAYKRKMKKRKIECEDALDKIIEYFVKKTGRYYRSKVYEDFCGVKLMLDDEKEIYFLANFDANTPDASTSDTRLRLSNASVEVDKKRQPNVSSSAMGVLKSKMSKSTSAVDTALDVIKQLELEREKLKANKMDSKTLFDEVKTILLPSENILPNKVSLNETSEHTSKIDDSLSPKDRSVKNIVSNAIPAFSGSQKRMKSHSAASRKRPSILKGSDCADVEHVTKKSALKLIGSLSETKELSPSTQLACKSNATVELSQSGNVAESERELYSTRYDSKQAFSSPSIAPATFADDDIDEMCRAISKTLKRIRKEKFCLYDNMIGSSNSSESESLNRKAKSYSITESAGESRTNVKNNTVIRDLFRVPRYATSDEKPLCTSNISQPSYHSTAEDSELSYSNFTFKDVGMATFEGMDTSDEHGTSSDDFAERGIPMESLSDLCKTAAYRKIFESESSVSKASSTLSEPDFSSSVQLPGTGSMFPLLNVSSLKHLESGYLDEVPISSVTFMGRETPSLRVLTSVSHIDKEFDMVVMETAGTLTDKSKGTGVQTDLYYKEPDDDDEEPY